MIAVVQPHRYTRLHDLMEDFQNAFNDADIVFVTPVYAAGEQPIEGVDAEALVELRAHGHRMVRTVADLDDLALALRDLAAPGDLIICMGAGDITKWAAAWRTACAGRERASERRHHPRGPGKACHRARRSPRWSGSRAAATAEWLFEPKDEEDLRASSGSSIRMPGHGARARVEHDRPRRRSSGVVVRLGKAFSKIEKLDDVTLRCGGGASGILVSSTARDAGIAGMEFLRGIPAPWAASSA